MPGLLDAVHQVPCPNEFGTQDAKSEQDYEPARARRHDHHEPQENDGEPDKRDGDAPSLFERAEEHRIENTSAAPANELKSWSMQKKRAPAIAGARQVTSTQDSIAPEPARRGGSGRGLPPY